ncbi:MAG TPA: aminoacyl-tRNA hydrolase [Gemmataceae bacterium]|jgi:PTH1 family peptidyl-tRNA hydrolase|nr:aminoacyl-tRNA hydrolase [Gemmataceae bacterium]
MKLVVGLGNPGPKYSGTRHNIGFMVVDYLAAAPGVVAWRSRFESQIAQANDGAEQVLLLKPETFMNLSGRAVRAVIDFYRVKVADVLIVCDDIALPLGKLRARAKGSDGGQKGLRSIQEHLRTADYSRLRIGVGSPGEHTDAADYVLSRFKPGERTAVDDAIAQAAQAVLLWIRGGIDGCMNKVNGEPKPPKPPKPKKETPAKTDESKDEKPPPKPED